MTSRRLGEATGHSSVLESFFVPWLTAEGPFSVHQRELLLCPVWRIKLLPDTKQQVKEISLISKGRHNSVLRRLGILPVQVYENLPISAGGGGGGTGRASEGGGSLGASHGARLVRASSAHTSHVGQPRGEATPSPTMLCVARHSERRVPARQVRPGPSFQPPRGLREP